jgi:hypothetical protein
LATEIASEVGVSVGAAGSSTTHPKLNHSCSFHLQTTPNLLLHQEGETF